MSDSEMSRRSFLKSALLGGLALTTGLTAHADTTEQESRAKVWVKKGKTVKSLSAFDTMMINFMSSRGISHGSLAVTKNSKLVLARGYSYIADPALGIMPNALFRIASLSKPITAVAILHMAQNNLLNLDEKLANYIPLTPIPGQTPDARLSDVTVRHLLHHAGGWNRDTTFDPMFRDFQIAAALGKTLPITGTDIIQYMSGRTLNFTPGTQYNYSNYGYLLLEQLFQARSGLSYAQYVRNNVWTPLGVKRTKLGKTAKNKRLTGEVGYVSKYSGVSVLNNSGAVVKSPYGAWNLENMKAHGGWASTAVDLVRFASAFDAPASSPLLSQSSINTMFAVPPTGAFGDGSWYGAGWSVRTAGAGLNTWHFGSLPGTFTGLIRRSDGLNWAFLFNERYEGSGTDNFWDIDWMVHQAADSIVTWPAHDLFPLYL